MTAAFTPVPSFHTVPPKVGERCRDVMDGDTWVVASVTGTRIADRVVTLVGPARRCWVYDDFVSGRFVRARCP